MLNQSLYLRQNIQAEPLIDSWYAWSQLIPPVTFARNLAELHLKIMDSYILAPQLHAEAVRNPQFMGGPFIDYDGQRVDEIKALRDRTTARRADLLELSRAIGELNALLMKKAKGQSLQPLYADIPDVLKGYVELNYDLNNQPSFRLIEPLLYRSRYYDSAAQSLLLSTISCDERAFALSTPRLPQPGSVQMDVPFADERIDTLFRMKTEPATWSAIRDLFDDEVDPEALRAFFTDEAPAPNTEYLGNGLRWRYFGHACILIEVGGVSILLDPVLSYKYENGISRFTYTDLPETIDYVLITHNHLDHLLFETMLQIRHRVRHVVVPRNNTGALHDPSMALLLKACGFRSVIELGEMDEIGDERATIVGCPFLGEHGDLSVGAKLAYLIRVGGESLLCAADSCNIEPQLYRHLRRAFGEVRALFLGMECNGAPVSWMYGPLMTQRIDRGMDESRRLSGSDYCQAMDLVEAFGCKDVYVYAMGQEPWLNYVMSIKYTDQSKPIVESNKLVAECRARGLTSERLFGEKEIVWNTVA